MALLGVRVSVTPEGDAQALALTLQQIVDRHQQTEKQTLQLEPSDQSSEWTVSDVRDNQHQLALACQLQWTTETRPYVQVIEASCAIGSGWLR